MANERMNLMNMAKLSIKGLIESALNLGRTLDSDYAPLQQFFVVMEHCLKHGLKGNPGWALTDLCSLHGTQERLSTVTAVTAVPWAGKARHKTCWMGKLRHCRCFAALKTAVQLSWV